MADIQKPPSVPVDDNWTVWAVPGGLANVSAPTIAELTATTTVDITCYLTHKRIGVTADQSTYPDPRLCSSKVAEKQGAVTEKAEQLEYIYDPQAPDSSVTNAAEKVLQQGARVDLVIRKGVRYGTAPTTSHYVEVLAGSPGVANDTSEATGGVYKKEQSFSLDNHIAKVKLA